MSMDPIKGRIISLSMKKATQGLTASEEAELQELQRQLALQQASGR